jgi:DNA repair protein RadC
MKRASPKNARTRVREELPEYKRWKHPGGKLLAEGPEALSDAELLAMVISSGIRGKSAEQIAKEIIEKFGSFKGIANQPLEKFYSIKGLKKVKIMRIAAAFEIARRIVNQVMREK